MTDLTLHIEERWGRRAGLERALREAIRSGRLAAGLSMPSTRVLAGDLGFSRATVVGAYEQLVAEGYLSARHGVGTVVAEVHSPPIEEQRPSSVTFRFEADFRPGEPDADLFPRRDWQRSMRQMMAMVPDAALGYPDPRGAVELRSSLADYLARSRAVVAATDAVSVFGGFAAAIGFLGEMFASRGLTEVAVEDPTLFITRDVLRLAGVRPVPIPIDHEGIDVDALDASGLQAVVVTPAHQYPLGVTMSPTRRIALIDWARRHEGWIVEDDYDGEFRYDRQPLGSLQGLDPNRVIYAGTASKSLIPGLRLAWLVVPAALRGSLAAVKHLRGVPSTLEQLTLADFIEQGRLDRHLRNARGVYRARQVMLAARLGDDVPQVRFRRPTAGLHLSCDLPPGVDEAELVRSAGECGLGLIGLGPHFMAPSDRQGLVIGYSRPAQHDFDKALDRLIDFLGPRLDAHDR